MIRLRDQLQEANKNVESIGFDDAVALLDVPGVVFVDVREKHELEEQGTIPGAVHVSRGLLELAVDPQSPMHNEQFTRNATFILFCASGVRSLLAAKTLMDMGVPKVKNLDGGFIGWRMRVGPVLAAACDSSEKEL